MAPIVMTNTYAVWEIDNRKVLVRKEDRVINCPLGDDDCFKDTTQSSIIVTFEKNEMVLEIANTFPSDERRDKEFETLTKEKIEKIIFGFYKVAKINTH